jgi:hypothetical protein
MMAMMPMVMTPPVVVTVPAVMVAPVTDAARTVVGPDHPAAAVRIIIGVVVIRIIGSSVEEAPVQVMVVREPHAAMAEAAVEDRTAM